jgi:hypothetical protein
MTSRCGLTRNSNDCWLGGPPRQRWSSRERSRRRTIFYSAEQRREFRTTLIPPVETAIWVGRCAQSNLLHGEARKLHVSNRTPTNPLEDGCATTFATASLVMQVLSVKRKLDAPRGSLSLKIRAGPWESKLVQIWPVERQRVNWPPPQSFSDLDDGLRDLRRRFAVGIRQND